MHKLLLFLLSFKLIFGQCPDLIQEFCQSQINCPTSNSLSINESTLPFSQFNAICLGNFQSRGGDVQGRLFVGGNMNVQSSLSIGVLLDRGDNFPYSLIVGGNLFWGSGSIYPENKGIFVGGNFTGASEIVEKRNGGPCTTSCLETELENTRNYFTSVSNLMSSLRPNVMTDNFGNLACNSNTSVFNVLEINDLRSLDMIQRGSQISNCNLDAILIINIKGNFQVNFTGSGFWQTNRIIWNIIGTRILRVQTQIEGVVLAPNSQLLQTGGVIVGNLIASECSATLQFNLGCVPSQFPSEDGQSTQVAQSSSGEIGESISEPEISETEFSQSGVSESESETQVSQSSPNIPSEASPPPVSQPETISQTRTESSSPMKATITRYSLPSSETISQTSLSTQTPVIPGIPSPISESQNCTRPLWEVGFSCEGFYFSIENSTISFQDFDVVVFGNLTGETGNIQGSAIVGQSARLGRSFAIGEKLPSQNPFTLVVGRNLNWNSGSFLPKISKFFAGNFESLVPLQIILQRIGSGCRSPDCLAPYFNRGQECYREISRELSNLSQNTRISFENYRTLVTCNSRSESDYVVNIPANLLNNVLWYEFENCNPEAAWVVNILGNISVLFQGSFPARSGNLVFNIVGDGRNVTIRNAAIFGSILAPMSDVYQSGGIIFGKVIARNLQVSDVSRARCSSSERQIRDLDAIVNSAKKIGISMFMMLLYFI